MGGYWGIYSGTSLIESGLGIANLPGVTDDVPEGIYTPDPQALTMLNYWSVNDPNHLTLLTVGALNGFRVTVGEVGQGTIPEPATLALTGLGLLSLLGVAALRRREASPPTA